MVGFLLTLVLPEPAGRNLEEVSGEDAEVVHLADIALPAEVPLSPRIPTVDLVAAGEPVAIPQD